MTIVLFDGKNYDLQERAVRKALKVNNKLGFIEGTLTRPLQVRDEEFSEAIHGIWLTPCSALGFSM